jgi:hypothetical protein
MIKDSHLFLILFVIFIIYCESSKIDLEHLEVDLNDDNGGFDLRDVQTMTFYKNNLTKGNRTAPIPQLNCVGGNACEKSYLIQSIQCTNTGTNENDDVQWKCSSNLPKNLRLNKTNVNCEGLRNSSDKIKLKNSCGLEYNLDYSSNNYKSNDYYTTAIVIIIIFIFVAVICFAIIKSPIGYRSYYPEYYHSYYVPYYSTPSWHDHDFGYRSYSSRNNDFDTSFGFGSTTTR